MLKTCILSFLCCIAAIILANSATAQTTADSADNGHALYATVENNFYKAIGAHSRLYNGEKYEFYGPSIKGNPYLMNTIDMVPGTVVYDGYTYSNINMLYDMYKDEVIIPLYKSFLKMSLISEKISSFDLAGHHFIYIKTGSGAINQVSTGFYDELYSGKITLFCRRAENIQQTQGFYAIDSYFLLNLDYYIYKNGEYFTVNSKGAFLNILKDKKKEIRQFINANKIKFKKDTKEQAMVKIAAYYDQLTD